MIGADFSGQLVGKTTYWTRVFPTNFIKSSVSDAWITSIT